MKKIAIIAPNRHHFGNIMTQLPLFCALRKKYPDAEITVWTKLETHQFLIKCKAVDKVEVFKGNSLLKLIFRLRKEKYDELFNIYSGSEKAHIASAFSGAIKKLGFSNNKWMSFCYDYFLVVQKGQRYIAFNNLALLNYFDKIEVKPSIISMLNETDNQLHKIKKETLSVVLVPGGGAGSYKRWDINNYCETAKYLLETCKSVEVIQFVLGPGEKKYLSVIHQMLPQNKVKIYDAPSVPTLIELAENSDLVIGNDCGPMHIFQMMESPIIMLWGWGDDGCSPIETMREWFYPNEHSWSMVPSIHHKTINSIPVRKICLLSNMILSRNN